jgi:hypothetical protein
MPTIHLRNISLKLFRVFLIERGCSCNRINGGHEHWTRHDLLRPITTQTHVDPIPESKIDFLNWI